MYVVWITDVEEYNVYAGVASTKEKAEEIVKRAYKTLKNKDVTPEDFSIKNNFEIERVKDGAVSCFVDEMF
jgi:hypothetical protein